MGEFVQRDVTGTADYAAYPGNARAWILGGIWTGLHCSYAFKVVESSLNQKVNRDIDSIWYNHLPMTSEHPGLVQFLVADGSVNTLTEDVEQKTYRALATCNEGEVDAGMQQ